MTSEPAAYTSSSPVQGLEQRGHTGCHRNGTHLAQLPEGRLHAIRTDRHLYRDKHTSACERTQHMHHCRVAMSICIWLSTPDSHHCIPDRTSRCSRSPRRASTMALSCTHDDGHQARSTLWGFCGAAKCSRGQLQMPCRMHRARQVPTQPPGPTTPPCSSAHLCQDPANSRSRTSAWAQQCAKSATTVPDGHRGD